MVGLFFSMSKYIYPLSLNAMAIEFIEIKKTEGKAIITHQNWLFHDLYTGNVEKL
jgi:hypothetical protein